MAMPVAADVRVYLPELTSTGDDAAIGTLLTYALAEVAAWIGFPVADDGSRTLTVKTYTITLDGPGDVALRLPVRPLASVVSLEQDGAAVGAGDYEYDAQAGVLYRLDGTNWRTGRRLYEVEVTAGWTTLPPDLADAVCRYVAHLYRVRAVLGKSSLAQQGSSTGLRTEAMPAAVRQIAERYTVYAGLI